MEKLADMNKKELENLIKENLKDTALRIHELDNKDRNSLIAEYKEWTLNDLDFDEVMMLPYEAYTNKLDRDFLDDLNYYKTRLLLYLYTAFAISGNKVSSLKYFSPLPKTTNKVCTESLLTHQAASCLACDISPALLQKLIFSGNPSPKKPST